MIFNNSPTAQSINANQIPQLFNPAGIALPFYNGAQINYRDSSWLKLNVCESFLKNECPNVDNCSLAHPPNTVKIENTKVTVCYDYIKKKDCKHGNCKYYHPHDALASAILRRGDDTKKNGNSLSNFGLTIGLRSPLQMPRSQDLLNLQAQNMLSSQINNNIMVDPQMKVKLENVFGIPDSKKAKPLDSESQLMPVAGGDLMANSQYYMPSCTNTISHVPSSPSHVHMPVMTCTNMPTNFNIIQASPLIQTAPMTGYHPLGSYNVNNLLLQSLIANNQTVANTNPNLDALLAFSGQKMYNPMSPYQQVGVAQMPLLNQLYYQQLLQSSLGAQPQILYPGSINIAELQQRTLEETSVAFINDKGTILETLPVCKDFLQGKCKRSQSCNYVHLLDPNVEIKDSKLTVCKNALKGQCHRPVCKFYHIPTYQLQKLGLNNQTT